MGRGNKKRPATEDDESSSSNERSSRSSDDRSSDDDSRKTSKHRRRRSQARKKSRKERSYSQSKEIKKLLAEVIKEEVRKQFDMIREEMCQQSKQQATDESKEEISKQFEKVREEICQQSKQAAESTEYICKQLNKVKEDLVEIHNDLCQQRELYTNDTSGDAFDAPRSESNEVQPPRYRLVFKSGAIDKIHKGQPFDIRVALVDGNDQTVENGLLASATVELVVVKAEFNQHNNQYNWSREDFESNIIKKEHQGNSAAVDVDQSLKSIVSDGRFNLFQGFKCHSGSKIFRNSGNKKVRIAVMIVSPTEERVLEGLSNPFFVRGHDRPARQSNLCRNRSNTQMKALVDNGCQLQNGQTPNPQNPLSPSATQNNNGGISGLNTTTRPPQLPFVGNTTLLSSGLNINGEPQLPFVGNTHMATEPSTSQQQRASIQRDPFPHMPMMARGTNNQIDELLSSALVLGSPNYVVNDHVPVHEFEEELPGRDGDTTDILELLPSGFRFRPTDYELIVNYMWNTAKIFPVHVITELDIYKFDPWDLPAAFGEAECYFFSPLTLRSYPNSDRPNRVAGSGYWNWKTTRAIPASARSDRMLGFKKTLVFYTGVPPEGKETGWVMHEYHRLISAETSTSTMRLDEPVLCRIYKKTRLSVPFSYKEVQRLGQQLAHLFSEETELHLPLGFRFRPTDKELILDYLLRRATGACFKFLPIAEVDIYKVEPWNLHAKAKMGDLVKWYFLHRREHESYATGTCPNRTTESGYWEETGIDRPITVSADDDNTKLMTIGFKKPLVFYMGRPPKVEKTPWMMQEYRLHDNLLSANESASSSTSSTSDEWLLYKVYIRWEPNQLTPPSHDDRLLQQLLLQDNDLSDSFLPPAPSTMPSSISDGVTHLTPTPSTPEPASSPWSMFL